MRISPQLLTMFATATLMAQVELRVESETIPSGGLLQIKVGPTRPTPITTTKFSMDIDDVFGEFEGVALFSQNNDTVGVALRQGRRFSLFASGQGGFGAAPDYPILTIAAPVRAGLAAGTKVPINLDFSGAFMRDPAGANYALDPKHGTLTIGGSISITNVIPGGGMLPAGTNVRLLGTGFTAQTDIQVNEVAVTPRFINANEINFTLNAAADLRATRIRAKNRDNSEATYYSYLRSTPIGASSRPLLAAAVPLFSNRGQTTGAFRPASIPANGFAAIALENSAQSPVNVLLELYAADNTRTGQSTVSMPAASRYSRTVQEIFGVAPATNGYVRFSAGIAIQAVGLIGDESTNSFAPQAFDTSAAPPPPAASLTVSPAALQFTATAGGAAPAAQNITIGVSGNPSPFAITSNAPWLSVNTPNGTAPAVVAVSVAPSALGIGTYSSSLTISPGITLPVTLTITGAPSISVSPASLNFSTQAGGAPPPSQNISLSSGLAAQNFTITANAPWLSTAVGSGTTPATVAVSANASALPAGTYTSSLTINGTQSVAVTLTVSAAVSLTVSPQALNFSYQTGAAQPGAQTLSVTSSGGPASFSITSNVPWITTSVSNGTAPATVSVSVNTAGFAPGNYSGTLTFNGVQTVTVGLVVAAGNTPLLAVTPSALTFSAQSGGAAPAPQQITLSSSSTPINFTISSSSPWLTASVASGTTPATVSVNASPAGLAAGTYNGTLTINGSVVVAVTLSVSGAAGLTMSPSSLAFAHQLGGSPPGAQTLNVGSTGAPLPFTIVSNASWLTTSFSSGTTPSTVSVNVNPAGLAAGVYTGSLILNGTASVTVTLTVSNSAVITVSAAALAFAHTAGDAAPSPRTVSISSTGAPLAFSITSNAAWLTTTVSNGVTPASISVNVNPAGLAAGTFTGALSINGTAAIAVTLTISAGSTITASPQSLRFATQSTAEQTISLASSGAPAAFALSSNAAWLTVSPSSGFTPTTIAVRVNATGLTPGEYTATLSINGAPLMTVGLTVPAAPSGFSIAAITNAASQSLGAISPGLLVSIYGAFPGPATPAGAQLRADGTINTLVAGTRVWFNNTAAPLIYVSNQQINAIVPFEVAGAVSASVQVESGGGRSTPIDVSVRPASPALFTANSSGRGQVSALNQDFSVNGAATPAAPGSIVQLFATGDGLADPPSTTGSINPAILRRTALPVVVLLNGVRLQPLFAGPAPGLAAGVMQVNFVVPSDAGVNAATPLAIEVGGVQSQAGTTIAIR